MAATIVDSFPLQPHRYTKEWQVTAYENEHMAYGRAE
jgi:hypothetical protein